MNTKLKKNNAGVTLAELIATFALTGIFLVSTTAIISSSVLIHSQLTGTMYAQSVGETLLDKITGELVAAKPVSGDAMIVGNVLKEGESVGNGVSFYGKDGNRACFFVEDGLLVLQSEDIWQLEQKAYMGYQLSDLQVNRLNDQNVFEVVIKLKNLKTGFEYTASKVVRCFNFKTEEDFAKISEGNISLNTILTE